MNPQQPDPNGPFAMQQRQKNEVEYVPFGGEDKIKLTVKIIQDLIAVKTRSGATCSERDAMKFLMLCRSRGLNPFEGDSFLIGYDGKDGPTFSLITAYQAFLKRAELHPEYDGIESGIVVMPAIPCAPCKGEGGREIGANWHICSKCNGLGMVDEIEGNIVPPDTKLIGGWARVHFKKRKIPAKKRLSLATFQQQYGRWQIDAAGMIVKCASAAALREAFPTKMGGMYLREEDTEHDVDRKQARVETPVDLDPITETVQRPQIVDVQTVTEAPTQPAAKEPKKREAKSGTPLTQLQSLMTLGDISDAEVIEYAVRKFNQIGGKTVADLAPEVMEKILAKWEDIAAQIRVFRQGSEQPN